MADNTVLNQANATVYAAQKQALKDFAAAMAVFMPAAQAASDGLGTQPVASSARDFISSQLSNASMAMMSLAQIMPTYGMNVDGSAVTAPSAPSA